MANKKISQLASASALAGTEVLPIVQAGTTKKVTAQAIADLASGGGGSASTIQAVVGGGVIQSNPLTLSYQTKAFLPKTGGTAEILTYPQAYLTGNGGTMTSLSFPSLTFCDFNIYSNTYLETLSFPALTAIRNGGMGGTLTVANNPALTTLSIPSVSYIDNGCFLYFYGNAFSQATVDHILTVFSATGANGCTLIIDGNNAAPSATGLAIIATLTNQMGNRNWNITYNS